MRIVPARERAEDKGASRLVLRIDITVGRHVAVEREKPVVVRRAKYQRIGLAQARVIRRLWNWGLTQTEIGRRFNTSQSHVSAICRGAVWPEPKSEQGNS